MPIHLRSSLLALAAALAVAACFSGPSLNRPPYRYNEPIPPPAAAAAPAKPDANTTPEKKPPPAANPPPPAPAPNPGG